MCTSYCACVKSKTGIEHGKSLLWDPKAIGFVNNDQAMMKQSIIWQGHTALLVIYIQSRSPV